MFLPFACQAGCPGKRCPAIALLHGHNLSWWCCKCLLLPRAVSFPNCILTIGKELAQIHHILIHLEGGGFPHRGRPPLAMLWATAGDENG